MRSYRVPILRMINQLVPHYLGGRKLILYLQACLKPLCTLSERWVQYANQQLLESSMTSQVILFENYLNRKFKVYFHDPSEFLFISDWGIKGIPVYWQSSPHSSKTWVLYNFNESNPKPPTPIYWIEGQHQGQEQSFFVSCPPINDKITQEEFVAMLAYEIRKYCIAGKSFSIIVQ